jgi:organic radical activating enzyme
MFIAGMQKLTLLDFPGVVACTLFTAGCNFRCPWCHNAGLVLPEEASDRLLESGEVLSFLEKRKGVLDGVCVTGGEPLLHAELPDFLKRVKDLGYRVKLDTNGSFPEALQRMIDEKLCDYVAFLHQGKLLLCEEKDRLLDEYGLIHCTAEELRNFPADAVRYKKENPYGVEAMVRRDGVPDGVHISPISIEELFVFMVKEAQ